LITLSGSAGGETSFGGLPIGDSNAMMSFVAKVSGSGEHRYSFGVEDDDTRAPIAVHSSGTLAIAGRAASDGFRVGEERYSLEAESYVSIHDSAGTRQWLSALGPGNEGEWTGAMAIDRDGDIVLERLIVRPDDVDGSARLFAELVKVSPDGLIDWSLRSHGGRVVEPFMPGGLAVDSQRAIIEVFQVQSSSIHVQKHTPDGAPVWSYRVEDNVTGVWGVATAPDDAVWLAHGEDRSLVLTKLRP
jgi:hypothetical protein